MRVILKQFSTECRKTKAIQSLWPITRDATSAMCQSEFEAITWSWRKARENVRKQAVAISFGFVSHWLKKWREFCRIITERSNAKKKTKANKEESPFFIRYSFFRCRCYAYGNWHKHFHHNEMDSPPARLWVWFCRWLSYWGTSAGLNHPCPAKPGSPSLQLRPSPPLHPKEKNINTGA